MVNFTLSSARSMLHLTEYDFYAVTYLLLNGDISNIHEYTSFTSRKEKMSRNYLKLRMIFPNYERVFFLGREERRGEERGFVACFMFN